ncbi:MAG: AAA family ATPase [Bacteroidia bacterium]|nr:AAA family ATPase [Bacteroidia bacterium]
MAAETPAFYESITDLHEELLILLLRYRRMHKGFTFWLASQTDNTPTFQWLEGDQQEVFTYLLQEPGLTRPETGAYFNIRVNLKAQWAIVVRQPVDSPDSLINPLVNFFYNVESSWIPIKYPARGFSDFTLHSNYADYPYKDAFYTHLSQFFKTLEKETALDQVAPPPESFFSGRLSSIQRTRIQPIHQAGLRRIRITNYNGIQSLTLEALPATPRWVFLTGENGFGKTSLLQAIATGLYGNTEDRIIPDAPDTRIEVVYQLEGAHRTYRLYNQTAYPELIIPLLPLACYGASRLSLQARESQRQVARNNTTTYHLFNDDGNLKNIEYELTLWYYKDRSRFDMIVRMLKTVIPALHDIKIDEKTDELRYIEQAAGAESPFQPVTFAQLASGMRSLIAMTGDIYLRLSAAMDRMREDPETFPFDLTPQNGGYYHPSELWGIVLIDELDVHLHPKWQRELPGMLSRVFPRVQFIASMHSPIPLLGAPEDSIILTVHRDPAAGITVERMDEKVDISTLLPNTLLTSPIFGFEKMIPESHTGETFIHTENTYEEVLANEDQVERISQFLDEEKMNELRKLFKS